ncbi:ABC transporter ATP-binding protein [Paenibacillus flagellatus]|uniref:Multidrug ABC transporter ATP-binding protein n=1 Tax=Paenibacillus flagellatus TaxID=2211139 RepID=A0A2V5KLK7_9BACL|nr:ABC transporter ATP-binding protein [Paenibacillus flagellatus]PYI55930.1 multidrug ABC transporter ATP-binding protein [Paenibacillus flagellatus]
MFKLFRYLKPYRASVTVVVLLMFVQSIAQLYLPTLMADIVDIGVADGDTAYILGAGAVMLLVAAGGTLCNVVAGYLSAKSASGFGKIVRGRVFEHVETFSLQEFDTFGTASLITRTTNDITQVQQVLFMMMRMFLSAPLMIVGGIVMAVSKDATLSLVLVAVLPLLVAIIVLVAAKGIPLFTTMQKKLDRLNLVLRENLTGIRVIRAFNRTDHERERYGQANDDLTSTAIRATRIMSTLFPIMLLILNLSIVAIMWFGSIRINNMHMQVGDLIAFTQYAGQIMFSLMMVSMMFMMIPRASASAVRINEVLNTKPSIAETPHAQKVDGAKGVVEFDDVTFSYPGAEQPAVSGVSFRASPGEVTAIIGGTGSGKSTIANLLLRFYDVESGAIRLDGTDIRDIGLESLRSMIGYVPQKAALFSGTVAGNIRFGNEAADGERIERAARTAQAHDFVAEMKDGFEAAVAQGGTNLSGGQKQRLSIARALARQPLIYVFDDSFSALDFKTDAKLREALRSETGEATVLIVAQRVSTIMNADRIVVLDEGRIAGIGTHRELLASCDVYREIVTSQLSEEEIA